MNTIIRHELTWEERNPDKVRAYKRAWQKRNPNRAKEYYEKNKANILVRVKIYQLENKEKLKKNRKNQYWKDQKGNIAKAKDYFLKNREAVYEYKRKYNKEHRDKVQKWNDDYFQRNPSAKFAHNLRALIRESLKWRSVKKIAKSSELLGTSIEIVRQHLENQFQSGMSWDNHGAWHIDHIRPLASYDLTQPEEQKKAFHYTNLQPLWALDNIKKGAKICV